MRKFAKPIDKPANSRRVKKFDVCSKSITLILAHGLKLGSMVSKNTQKKSQNYFGAYCQPKLSGLKCLITRIEDGIEIKDLDGKIIDDYAHIERAVNTFLPKDIVLVGYISKDSEFHATDCRVLGKDLVFKDRLEQLLVLGKKANLTGAGLEFKIVPTLRIESKEELDPIKEYFTKIGFDEVELVGLEDN